MARCSPRRTQPPAPGAGQWVAVIRWQGQGADAYSVDTQAEAQAWGGVRMSDLNDRDRQQRELTKEFRRSANARAERKRPPEASRPPQADGEARQEQRPREGERVRQLPDPEEPLLATIQLPEGQLNVTLASTAPAPAS